MSGHPIPVGKAPPGPLILLRRLIWYSTICWLLIACAVPISYYDATTYRNLTSLKAETMLLIEKFDSAPVAQMDEKIEGVKLKLRQAYEYELGKGEPNSDTAVQFSRIVELFDEDVADYREEGPGVLGARYFSEAAVVLGQAFDIAIATENLKNRDKQ